MENTIWVALPFIGLTGGFFSGFLGLGGGVIILPLLTFLGGVPLKLATGTDLVHVLIAAATGTLSHSRGGMIDLKAGLVLGLAGVVGGFVGSFLSVPLSIRVLQSIYLFVVALAAVLLLIPFQIDFQNYKKGDFNNAAGIAIGFGVGSLAGLLGVGGGFVIIPLMIYVLKIPLRVTIGPSLLIILITSLGTIWVKFRVGHINISITFLVLLGSVPGALFGAYLSRRTQVMLLRMVLLIVLVVIFLTVGYKTVF